MSLRKPGQSLNTDFCSRREFARQLVRRAAPPLTGAVGVQLAMQWMRSLEAGAAEPTRHTHFKPRARRVVFLHQSGAPSQIDLFDPKPKLNQLQGSELPKSVRMGQRLTTMTNDQDQLALVGSPYSFRPYGEAAIELSSQLPHTAKVADHLCVIRSMTTEAINHDPAITFMQTGSQQPGRPSIGAWLSYGLARESANLPDFVVMVSGGRPGDQPLSSRLWGAGFLPTEYAGVRMRNGRDPLLFLRNPPGVDRAVRGLQLEAIEQLDALGVGEGGALEQRRRRYEQAFQLQDQMPAVADVADEPPSTWKLYGEEAKTPGTYAANCLRARRLLEEGVPFVQLYHRGWDHHDHILQNLPIKCEETDRGSAALVADLHRRGLLEDTLVVWGGEFGRTAYCQGALEGDAYGRDHHPRCFSIWLAGAGVKPGVHGVTDELSYNVVKDPVHVHDLQATMLHLLGFDHKRLTHRAHGRDYRLTDQFGEVVKPILG